VFWRRSEFLHWDGSYYVGLAESLLFSGTYHWNGVPHTMYPPGMPLILAAVIALFGSSYPPQIITIGILSALGLGISFLLLRQKCATLPAFLICLCIAASPGFFTMSTVLIISDTAYFLLSALILVTANLVDSSSKRTHRLGGAAAITLLLPASILVRAVGIAMLLGLALWVSVAFLTSRARFKNRLLHFGPAILTGAMAYVWWTWYSKAYEVLDWPGQYLNSHARYFKMRDILHPEYGTATIADILWRITVNLPAQATSVFSFVTNYWLNPFFPSPAVVLPIVLLTISLAILLCSHSATLAEWYLPIYLAIILLWPYTVGMERFLYPVMPLILFHLWNGCRQWLTMLERSRRLALGISLYGGALLTALSIARAFLVEGGSSRQSLAGLLFWAAWTGASVWLRFRWPVQGQAGRFKPILARTGAVLLVAVLAIGVKAQIQIAKVNLKPPPSFRQSEQDAALWLKANTPGEAIVVAEQVPIVHRFSGRRTIHFPISSDPALIRETIFRRKAQFLVVNDAPQDHQFQPTQQARVDLVNQAYPGLLRLRAQTPGYRIFEVIP